MDVVTSANRNTTQIKNKGPGKGPSFCRVPHSSRTLRIGVPIEFAQWGEDGSDCRTSTSHNIFAFVLVSPPQRTVISTEAARAFREQRSGEICFSTSNIAPHNRALAFCRTELTFNTFFFTQQATFRKKRSILTSKQDHPLHNFSAAIFL
jgi:hypothetical protein